jgi:hypothetical protein
LLPPPWNAQGVDQGGVRVKFGGEDATAVVAGGAEHCSASSVTEQHAGGAILPVEDAAQQLDAHDQHALLLKRVQ